MADKKKIPPSKPHRYAKSLRVSWKEGIPAQIMISITDYYITPLALFLGASAQQIGLLVAIPHLLGSFSQFLSVRIVRIVGARLPFLVKGTALQALVLLPIAFLPVLYLPNRIFILIGLLTIFRVMGHLIGTVWGSLTSDYLAPEERGRYFGWRSQIASLAGVFGVIAGGLTLFFMKKVSPAAAFLVLFLSVSLARFISAYLMTKMEDIPLERLPGSDFTFYRFLKRFKESNFVKFVFFIAAITFATNLAAPYFNVYLLRDLHANYLMYMLVQLASIAGGLIAFPIWGKHADRFGNARILKLTSWLIPVIPFMWAFAPNIYFIPPIEIAAGFVWGGFNLCCANFIFDAVTSDKRVRCFAYFAFINGVALFFGASLGGYLADKLPPFRGHSLLTLALISGVLRFLAHFLLSPHFTEVRASAVKVSSRKLLFSVVGIRPLFGRDTDWNLLTFIKKSSKW